MDYGRRDFLKGVMLGALATAVPAIRARAAAPPTAETKPVAKLKPFGRRGIHVMGGGEAAVPALEQLIGEIAPALSLNWVIVEVNGGFAYQSHPECADERPMTKDSARKLAALARKKKIHLVPMYNCLGHQSWHADVGALLRAHPEFNEAPELDPTARGFYCMSWCPNNPDVNKVVFDLFDELIDAFEADAFHAGMDEVFILGHCPRCKGKANADLFAKAVNDIHRHVVRRRHFEMQMWGDRLIDGKATATGEWEASGNDTWQAIDKIPKDIVMCDWHYELANPEFPSVRMFQQKGFRVWPSGWNDEAAIRRFIEVARKEQTPKMLGYLCTTWMEAAPIVAGLAGGPVDSGRRGPARVIAGIKLGAQLARGEEAPVVGGTS